MACTTFCSAYWNEIVRVRNEYCPGLRFIIQHPAANHEICRCCWAPDPLETALSRAQGPQERPAYRALCTFQHDLLKACGPLLFRGAWGLYNVVCDRLGPFLLICCPGFHFVTPFKENCFQGNAGNKFQIVLGPMISRQSGEEPGGRPGGPWDP